MNILNVYNWPITEFEDQIPDYKAQGALINDCVYKAMYKTKYLLLYDVDEVIVPQKAENWLDAINQLGKCDGKTILQARHAFSLKNYPDFEEVAKVSNQFLDLIHRTNFTFPCPIRTKLIIQPEEVERVGVHFVYDKLKGREECCLSEEDFLLQHYRLWMATMEQSWVTFKGLYGNQSFDPNWEKIILGDRLRHFQEAIRENIQLTTNAIAHNVHK
jgi:hypothetical protein